MGQLIEVVFEDVNEEQVAELCSAVKDVDSASELVSQAQQNSLGETDLPSLRLSSSVDIVNAHLRVLAYEDGPFDVELNFDLDQQTGPSNSDLQEGLHVYSTQLAARHGVRSFFAGLDPASDEDTRIFTGSERGPSTMVVSMARHARPY